MLNKWISSIVDCACILDRRLTNQEDLLTIKCVELRQALEAGDLNKKPALVDVDDALAAPQVDIEEDRNSSLLIDAN